MGGIESDVRDDGVKTYTHTHTEDDGNSAPFHT